MLAEVGKTIGHELYSRLQTPPRQASRFTPLVAGVICAKMMEGVSFSAACSLLGFSSATVARWRLWAAAGEDPYAALIECCQLAQREYLAGKFGISAEEADAALRRVTG